MSSLEETRKKRPGREWVAERIFRPLAQPLVAPLARHQVRPEGVVLAHTALGFLIVWQLRQGRRVSPAVLLQVRTVLDGLDGQLARATGQTTQTGRYLDTEMDLLVNLALNSAIEGRAGLPFTVLQSLILTVDYLWERDYRLARHEVFREVPAQSGDHPHVLAFLRAVYGAYFTPQEHLLNALFQSRLRRLTAHPTAAQQRAYTPLTITSVASNMGLSTQHLLLGTCILLGRPRWYTRSLPFQALVLLGVQLWREHQIENNR